MTSPAETPVRACGICTRPLEHDETQTCHRCHIRTRGHLLDIVELYATLPDHLAVLTGIRYEPGPRSSAETPVVGGDALVLAAGGNGNNVTASRRGNRDHALDQWHTDPPSVVAELERWEDDWREYRRDPAAPRKATVTTASDYLLSHMRWASVTHPGFAEFAEDIRRLRARMRVVTGDIQRPVRADASCFDCGGTLVYQWTDDGLDDNRTCDDCGQVYTVPAYLLAVRARIEQERITDPNALVDIAGARQAFPEIPASTIRRWAHEGRLERAEWGQRGRALYRLRDIVNLITTLREKTPA